MRPTYLRRLRDGLRIRCSGLVLAHRICSQLNRIGVPKVDGHYAHDRVTWVVEER